jgi:hypothetical protein
MAISTDSVLSKPLPGSIFPGREAMAHLRADV